MSREEKEIEKPDKILNIVNDQVQRRVGLKILTPNQILSRLPITLTQLKAGNNSEKFKNGIRQLVYSLYNSKVLTKTIYNNLIKTFKNGNNLYEH